MILVFIEYTEELDSFLQYLHKNELKLSEFNIVALSTAVQVVLLKRKIKYKNTLAYFGNESHRSCLLKSDSIVQFLNKELKVNSDLRIDGYKEWYVFLIRHLVNHILWLIEIVSNAVSETRPEEILVIKIQSNNYHGPFINEDERYLSSVVSGLCSEQGYLVNEIKSDKYLRNHNSFSRIKPKTFFLHTRSILQGFCKEVKSVLSGIDKFDVLKKNKTLLVLSLGYNLDRVCQEIKRLDDSVKVVFLQDESTSIFKKFQLRGYHDIDYLISYNELPTRIDSVEKKDVESFLKCVEDNYNLFAYKGFGFFQIIKAKILAGITRSTEELIEKSYQMSYLIETIKPDLSLSYSSRGLTYVLGELCRNNDLKALCISHGSVVPPKNEIEEIVNRNIGESVILNKYPSVAVQTPLAKEFLDHYEHPSEEIITGPLVFGRKSNSVHSDKIINILHAVTLKSRGSMKFWGVEHNDEFVSSLGDIINVVGSIDNIKLIIKLHPTFYENFTSKDLNKLLPETESYVVSDRTLEEELSVTDLVVSFSSTVIEEAIINRIPVMLYDKWDRYKHYKALDLKDKLFKPFPLYYINSRKDLEENLDSIVTKGLTSHISKDEWGHFVFPEEVKQNYYHYLRN
ncbi:MAG: hypothetical protein HOG49_10395 [Candidatus Scalindua sp.]|jgi:hypothetical protein|nr:hypothetical protein [Candidatus Scalindua sp.]